MRLTFAATALFVFAALSPAPIQQRDPGQQPRPEISDEVRQQVQGSAVITAPTPSVNPETSPQVAPPVASGEAERALARANEEKAVAALHASSERIEGDPSAPLRTVIYGLAFLACGVGVVFLVRNYADKNIPMPQGPSEPS